MTDINNKVSINVNKDQGLVSAIKTKLSAENINTSNISWNVWTKILEQVKNENEQNKAEGKELIYHKGSNASGSGKDNFVIFQGVIKFSQTLWNNICKLAKGEPLNETPTPNPTHNENIETNPEDITLQNRTNTLKAINAIQNNIANLELPPNVDKSKINEIMAELSKNGLTLPQQSVSVGDMTASLLIDLLTKLMPNASEEEINYYAIKNAANFVPDNTIGGRKCSELANNDDLIRGMTRGTVQETTLNQQQAIQPQQIKFNKEELQIKIDNIKTKLGSVLKGRTFNAPNGKTVSGEDLLKILDNINFENNNYGAARADKSTSQILINLNGTYSSNSDAEIMKIILHEALHCLYQDTKMNTWEEERCCESQALALTAEIVQAEKTNPSTTFTSYSAYGQNIENFTNNTDLLNGVINNWLETGYANRPKNAQGDITILKDSSLTSPQVLSTGSREYLNPNNRIEIQSGDEIYIDGKLETNIGEAILESAKLTNNGNSNKFQLYIPSENNRMLGIVAFDGCVDHTEAPSPNITARTIEITRNGEVVCTGKIYFVENSNIDTNPPLQDTFPPQKDINPPSKSSIRLSTPPSNIPSLDNANTMVDFGLKSVKYDNNGYESEYYDNQGNMTRSICRSFDDNEIIFYDDFEYNVQGKVARQISYYPNGSFNHCVDNEYDAKGNLTREIHRNSDGTVDYYTDYEYDALGNVAKEILRNADGTVFSYLEYQYNDQRVTMRKIYRNSDGSVNFYQNYEYDSQGSVIEEIKRKPDGTLKED